MGRRTKAWSEYFELVSIYVPGTNDFGEVDSVTSYFAIALKTEYLDLIDTENSKVTVELFFAQGKQYGTFSDDCQSFAPDGEYDKLEGHDRTEVHTLGMTDYG